MHHSLRRTFPSPAFHQQFIRPRPGYACNPGQSTSRGAPQTSRLQRHPVQYSDPLQAPQAETVKLKLLSCCLCFIVAGLNDGSIDALGLFTVSLVATSIVAKVPERWALYYSIPLGVGVLNALLVLMAFDTLKAYAKRISEGSSAAASPWEISHMPNPAQEDVV